MKHRRFWFEFEGQLGDRLPPGTLLGCGVTASNYDDAIRLIQEKVFDGHDLPPITKCIEDVDLSILDQNHIIPNMGYPTEPGVWFPLGYE